VLTLGTNLDFVGEAGTDYNMDRPIAERWTSALVVHRRIGKLDNDLANELVLSAQVGHDDPRPGEVLNRR